MLDHTIIQASHVQNEPMFIAAEVFKQTLLEVGISEEVALMARTAFYALKVNQLDETHQKIQRIASKLSMNSSFQKPPLQAFKPPPMFSSAESKNSGPVSSKIEPQVKTSNKQSSSLESSTVGANSFCKEALRFDSKEKPGLSISQSGNNLDLNPQIIQCNDESGNMSPKFGAEDRNSS